MNIYGRPRSIETVRWLNIRGAEGIQTIRYEEGNLSGSGEKVTASRGQRER